MDAQTASPALLLLLGNLPKTWQDPDVLPKLSADGQLYLRCDKCGAESRASIMNVSSAARQPVDQPCGDCDAKRRWKSVVHALHVMVRGGGKWVEITVHADPLYQHLLLTAEKKFWRCVMNGEEPRLFGVEPPRPRLEAVRSVDMSASNSWAEFSATYCRTRQAHLDHEGAKAELKKLVPEDAREAFGHGVKGSKSGAISFELAEAGDAPQQ
jgi:hypothetical protein